WPVSSRSLLDDAIADVERPVSDDLGASRRSRSVLEKGRKRRRVGQILAAAIRADATDANSSAIPKGHDEHVAMRRLRRIERRNRRDAMRDAVVVDERSIERVGEREAAERLP